MPPARRANILLVDDNPAVREVLRGILRQEAAFNVIGDAANGQMAIDLVGTLQPDLVCLDLMMPGIDGLEVLARIRKFDSETRVVFISGALTPAVISQALKAGASGFVVKPFSAAKVLQTLHTVLAAPVPAAVAEKPAA
jgi:two-component system, chemotaxis family, chemotaxis protein CheY